MTLDPRPLSAEAGCGECQGWPGHHPGCSKYGIPRTEAGARLLVTLENLIYRGGTIGDVARADVVAIEDEAEVRCTNRLTTRPGHQTPGEFHDYSVSCAKCGEPGYLHVSLRPETYTEDVFSPQEKPTDEPTGRSRAWWKEKTP